MLMRGATCLAVLAMRCSCVCCASPDITKTSPCSTLNVSALLPFLRVWNVRVPPILIIAIVASSRSAPLRSLCHATLSAPLRYRLQPACSNLHSSRVSSSATTAASGAGSSDGLALCVSLGVATGRPYIFLTCCSHGIALLTASKFKALANPLMCWTVAAGVAVLVMYSVYGAS